MFVEALLLVTYRLIIVTKNSTLYTNISPSSIPLPLASSFKKFFLPYKDTFSATIRIITQYVSRKIIALNTIINQVLRDGDKRQRNRNFGKNRRKQFKRYSYKLRKYYTHMSTKENRRTSSKNEGATSSDNRGATMPEKPFFNIQVIEDLVAQFDKFQIYKKGRNTRMETKSKLSPKSTCHLGQIKLKDGNDQSGSQLSETETKDDRETFSACYCTEKGYSCNIAKFDTDSYQIKVDTGCSVSSSGVITDFVPGSLKVAPAGLNIQSYGGAQVPVTHMGTIRWYVPNSGVGTTSVALRSEYRYSSAVTSTPSPSNRHERHKYKAKNKDHNVRQLRSVAK
jgi:hypothetical protein